MPFGGSLAADTAPAGTEEDRGPEARLWLWRWAAAGRRGGGAWWGPWGGRGHLPSAPGCSAVSGCRSFASWQRFSRLASLRILVLQNVFLEYLCPETRHKQAGGESQAQGGAGPCGSLCNLLLSHCLAREVNTQHSISGRKVSVQTASRGHWQQGFHGQCHQITPLDKVDLC